MGIFDEASSYEGSFYRKFSQENPLDSKPFAHFPVAVFGICAGLCYSWLKFYLTSTDPAAMYTNQYMLNDAPNIIAVMNIVRSENIPVYQLLSHVMWHDGREELELLCNLPGNPWSFECGTAANPSGPQDTTVPIEWLGVSYEDYISINCRKAEALINRVGTTVVVVRLLDQEGAHHVAVGISRGSEFYFMDANKGDVKIPKVRHMEWLKSYLKSFLKNGYNIELLIYENPIWSVMGEGTMFFEGVCGVRINGISSGGLLRKDISSQRLKGVFRIGRPVYDDRIKYPDKEGLWFGPPPKPPSEL